LHHPGRCGLRGICYRGRPLRARRAPRDSNGSGKIASVEDPGLGPPRTTVTQHGAARRSAAGLTGNPADDNTPLCREAAGDVVDGIDVVLNDIWGGGSQRFLLHYPEACEASNRFRARSGTVISLPTRRALRIRCSGNCAAWCPDETYEPSSVQAIWPGIRRRTTRPEDVLARPGTDNSIYRGPRSGARAAEQARYIVCTGLFDDETESAEDYRARMMMQAAAERKLTLVAPNPDISSSEPPATA